jgi:ABC-type glycerol-3-phosphate transport system permease component
VRPRRVAASLIVHAVLAVAAGLAVVPFVWLVCASVKPHAYVFSVPFLPWDDLGAVTGRNYTRLFEVAPFGRWVVNSLFLASGQTVVAVALSSLGGYAMAKYRFRGRGVVFGLVIATMLLPGQVLLPSSYELMYHLGWVNSYAAILAPGAVSALGMYLFRQAMIAVPDELLDAARLDGCGELRLWWDIALPAVRPMTGAFTLLTFTGHWNSFVWPQIILHDEGKYTLPIALAGMIGAPGFETEYGMLMAATLLSILPVALLFVVLQRDVIDGLVSGAIKA